jgi:hypothetical protein
MRDNQVELVNAQTERLFGCGRDELAGRPAECALDPGVHLVGDHSPKLPCSANFRKSSAFKPDHTSRHGRLKGLLGELGNRDKENGSCE